MGWRASVPAPGGPVRAEGDGRIDRRVGQLAGLLGGHQPIDEDEAADLAEIQTLIDRLGGAALDRYTFDPGHLTASGFVLSEDGRRLLLVRHRRLGIWIQPGGHVEEHDASVEAAARREISEETGLESLALLGMLDVDVHEIPAYGIEPVHRHFDMRFAYRSERGGANPRAGVTAVQWTPLAGMEEAPVDRGIRRAARKLQVRASESSGR